jgi:hypothetical protein
MKRGTLIWVAALAVVVTGGMVAYSNRPAAHMRRPVDYWVHDSRWAKPWQSTYDWRAQQADGVRALGTEAVPLLVVDAERQENAISKIQRRLAEGGPKWLRRWVRPRLPHWIYRAEAIRALGALGSEAHSATTTLVRCLSDPEVDVQIAAAESLAKIGNGSPEVIAALRSAATNGDPDLTFLASVALWRLQPTNAAVAQSVHEALSAQFTWRSVAPASAADLLSEMRIAAKPFARPLTASVTNSTSGIWELGWNTKARVAAAVWRIDGSCDAALSVLDMLTNNPPPTVAPSLENRQFDAYLLTGELGHIPEFCRAIEVWLKEMPMHPGDPFAWHRSNAIAQVEHTLRTAATNATPFGPSTAPADK